MVRYGGTVVRWYGVVDMVWNERSVNFAEIQQAYTRQQQIHFTTFY